jgi:hypothetical protein
MRYRAAWLLCLMACPSGESEKCYEHCWEEWITIPDANNNGYFDVGCTNYYGGGMQVPLPQPEIFLGHACVETQADQDNV